jgi:DNA-binding SARP family transcriptional activator
MRSTRLAAGPYLESARTTNVPRCITLMRPIGSQGFIRNGEKVTSEAEFRLLGPVDLVLGEESMPLGGPRSKALLAALLLDTDRVVPVDGLIDAAWGIEAPGGARVQVQNRISTLRKILQSIQLNTVIESAGGGYRIRSTSVRMDLAAFRQLERAARQAVAQGELLRAADHLGAALALWRGPALLGLDSPRMEAASRRLAETEISTWEKLIDIELRLGRHREVTARLFRLVAENPWRERLVGQLMCALHRSGRTQEALSTFERLRRGLADETGLNPGHDLVRLRDLILRDDASLGDPQ